MPSDPLDELIDDLEKVLPPLRTDAGRTWIGSQS
jgi:hypothetical protein